VKVAIAAGLFAKRNMYINTGQKLLKKQREEFIKWIRKKRAKIYFFFSL
jgi:hypothetical protein